MTSVMEAVVGFTPIPRTQNTHTPRSGPNHKYIFTLPSRKTLRPIPRSHAHGIRHLG